MKKPPVFPSMPQPWISTADLNALLRPHTQFSESPSSLPLLGFFRGDDNDLDHIVVMLAQV